MNGWFPATYQGRTGYVSAQYVNMPTTPTTPAPTTPTTPAPTTPTTPAPVPHTPANPNTPSGSNPFYSPGSTYGSHQNWVNTPLVTGAQNPQAEWERSITQQGYGGTGVKSSLARDLYGRAQAGHQAASMNNPNLDFRSYLNTLGPNFIRDQIAAKTPFQKGELYGVFAPRSRWTPR